MNAALVVIRWWLRYPWHAWLLLTAVLMYLVASPMRQSAIWASGALWFASLVQGLRASWPANKPLVSLVAGLPALASVVLLVKIDRDWSLLLLWTPALSAILVECVARAMRRRRLPPVEERAPPAAIPDRPAPPNQSWMARNASGCVTGLLLLGSCSGWVLVRITEPGRNAAKAHSAIRQGMTLPEVLSVTQGGLSATLRSSSHEKHLRIWSFDGRSWALEDGDRQHGSSLGRDPALKWMEEQASGWKHEKLYLTFTASGVPARVSFVVSFGSDGRVSGISEKQTRD